MIEKFIDLAVELRSLHNFTGLNSVVSGLRLDPTLKLKSSWDRVPPAKVTQLQVCVVVPSGSCRDWRFVASPSPVATAAKLVLMVGAQCVCLRNRTFAR